MSSPFNFLRGKSKSKSPAPTPSKKAAASAPPTPSSVALSGSDSLSRAGTSSTGSSGGPAITCSILLADPASAAAEGAGSGSLRKKFEVLQVSFTPDATAASVIANIKSQSTKSSSLSFNLAGICRPGSPAFLLTAPLSQYSVSQNELLLGVPADWTSAATATFSESMRRSAKLAALLKSMEVATPRSAASIRTTADGVDSPGVVVSDKVEGLKGAESDDIQPTGSTLEVVYDSAAASGDRASLKRKSPAEISSFSSTEDAAHTGESHAQGVYTLLFLFVILCMFGSSVRPRDLSRGLAPGRSISHVAFPDRFGDPSRGVISRLQFWNRPETTTGEVSGFLNFDFSSQRLALSPDGLLQLVVDDAVKWSTQLPEGACLSVSGDNAIMAGDSALAVPKNIAAAWPFDGYTTASPSIVSVGKQAGSISVRTFKGTGRRIAEIGKGTGRRIVAAGGAVTRGIISTGSSAAVKVDSAKTWYLEADAKQKIIATVVIAAAGGVGVAAARLPAAALLGAPVTAKARKAAAKAAGKKVVGGPTARKVVAALGGK